LKTVVNEFGLYSLILSSRKPEAKAFKRWITHEVIPSIRKTGFYQLPTEPEDIMIETLKTQKEIKAKLKLVQDDIHDLKQEINLSRSQKHHLAGLVRKNVYNALGGKRAQAYNNRNLRARLYSNHWREIKNYFDVEAYEEIPKLKFGEAIEFAELWEPSTELKMLIKERNNQIPLGI
ncbi:MAG: ORF6C domain-containing protein, partial [Carnobacterium sp.]|uniref:ORF6C domain-containing protein n=1 Tax=Carnobacterium sp. TaxID=48221 RepID=UPI0033160595